MPGNRLQARSAHLALLRPCACAGYATSFLGIDSTLRWPQIGSNGNYLGEILKLLKSSCLDHRY